MSIALNPPLLGAGASLLSLMTTADAIVQLILLVLIGMSVVCWAVIAQKVKLLREVEAQNRHFEDQFWASKRLDVFVEQLASFDRATLAPLFLAAWKEANRDRDGLDPEGAVARALRRAQIDELTRLEKNLPILATTGSTGPFIGLLGTVWGILQAFMKLGEPGAQATIQAVGPDIAHALVATAVGLVAAIPAVMAYNHLAAKIHELDAQMETFSADFLNLLQRKG